MLVLMMEGQQFMDGRCFELIRLATEHAQKFYELNKKRGNIRQELEVHLHRCYYNKASVLLLTKKFDDALSLFKKVYEFERSHGQEADA